jgi:hypothetical protein
MAPSKSKDATRIERRPRRNLVFQDNVSVKMSALKRTHITNPKDPVGTALVSRVGKHLQCVDDTWNVTQYRQEDVDQEITAASSL